MPWPAADDQAEEGADGEPCKRIGDHDCPHAAVPFAPSASIRSRRVTAAHHIRADSASQHSWHRVPTEPLGQRLAGSGMVLGQVLQMLMFGVFAVVCVGCCHAPYAFSQTATAALEAAGSACGRVRSAAPDPPCPRRSQRASDFERTRNAGNKSRTGRGCL